MKILNKRDLNCCWASLYDKMIPSISKQLNEDFLFQNNSLNPVNVISTIRENIIVIHRNKKAA